ncbi:Chitinase 1 [Podochytrium sp. JEL0797]|nr:Chitinase 1 [Podochytrium sp. JEL0797]
MTTSPATEAPLVADSKAADTAAAWPAKRNKLVAIGAAAVVLIVAASLVGYFVAKNHTSTGGSASPMATNAVAANGTGSLDPGAGNASVVATHKLWGYYGADATDNGVDIVKGTLPPVNNPLLFQKELRYYCDTKNFDSINLAFLNLFGPNSGPGGFTITFGGFSNGSYGGTYTYKGGKVETNDPYTVSGLKLMGQDIQYCQKTYGIKVIMSLGGDKVSDYSFGVGDGARYAQIFYDMFLEGNGPVRPFGPGVILDGIELDIEKNPAYPAPSPWTGEMVTLVKTLRQLSPKTTLAMVPQCYINDLNFKGKDQNIGDVLPQVSGILDYLIVQYYNNRKSTCSYPFAFNFKDWTKIFPGTIVVGLAGDWTSAISGGFLEAGPLQAVYDMVKTDKQFGGFSVYDVSSSTAPSHYHNAAIVDNSGPLTDYSTTLRNVLNGQVVGSGYPSQDQLGSTTDKQYAQRCGGTWVYANATCSLKSCTSNSDCGIHEQCFMYLATKC